MGVTSSIVIVGGGAAGLTLATVLAAAPQAARGGARVVVVERDWARVRRRRWSYWTDEGDDDPFAALAERTWARLRLVDGDGELLLPLERYRYRTVRGEALVTQLDGLAGVERVDGAVAEVVDGAEGARVLLDDGRALDAAWVLDARPATIALGGPPSAPRLTQRFWGLVLEADRDAFDAGAVTLFDLRPSQGEAFRFGYVLPLGERHALVELVTTAPAHARDRLAPDAALAAWLVEAFGALEAHVHDDEQGASLLTARRFRRRAGARHLRVGVAGGRIQPSSGYGFRRALEDARAIARSLARRGHPFALPRARLRDRLLDAVLLEVLAHEPARAAPIFSRMLRRNPIERVLRLLDGRAGWREILAVAASLPPWPFVVGLARHTARALRLLRAPPPRPALPPPGS